MSSKPFFSLATYFARRHSEISGPPLSVMPPRPEGTVIWVWATDSAQINTLRGLETQLSADGDQISFAITLPELPSETASAVFQAPSNRGQTEIFLNHWQPDLVLWMRDGLEPAVLVEISDRKVPCILLEATKAVLRPEHGGWVPGLARALIQQFNLILTVDAEVSTALLKAGADPNKIEPLGMMETTPAVLPHFEDERQLMSKAIGPRPIWLAADASLAEVDLLADAHHQASLQSHRLLLIVTPRAEADGPIMAEQLRERGFLVALRSADEEPEDAIQIYVADFEGELGMWYRIAPITYLGNSLTRGPVRNPYEAAILGSAIVHGPNVAPYQTEISHLQEANGCISLRSAVDLGRQIESHLAPDKAALVVHAAWEVTSRGAEISTRIAEIIMARLDALGS